MVNPKSPEGKTAIGSSGMEYDVKMVPDNPKNNPDVLTEQIQAGTINGAPVTPIYEGD